MPVILMHILHSPRIVAGVLHDQDVSAICKLGTSQPHDAGIQVRGSARSAGDKNGVGGQSRILECHSAVLREPDCNVERLDRCWCCRAMLHWDVDDGMSRQLGGEQNGLDSARVALDGA